MFYIFYIFFKLLFVGVNIFGLLLGDLPYLLFISIAGRVCRREVTQKCHDAFLAACPRRVFWHPLVQSAERHHLLMVSVRFVEQVGMAIAYPDIGLIAMAVDVF